MIFRFYKGETLRSSSWVAVLIQKLLMWNGRSAKNTGVNKWQKWQESNVWREQKKNICHLTCSTPLDVGKELPQTILLMPKLPSEQAKVTSLLFRRRLLRWPSTWSGLPMVTGCEGNTRTRCLARRQFSLHPGLQVVSAGSHLRSMWGSISHFFQPVDTVSLPLNPTLGLRFTPQQ